jgi:nucleoside-diphosphate-sugar epimerase
MSGELVVVTGGSGFVGTHCIVQLLNAGYRVRTTVRSLKREAEVRTMVREGGAMGVEGLSFVVADLMADAGWTEAIRGCTYVLHVASPFPAKVPKHEDELIVPAREGTLRVLRHSRDAKVKRVVLTSSFAAIGYGHPPQETPFDETSWTNVVDKDVSAYAKSRRWQSARPGISSPEKQGDWSSR